jgi:hypothetical protein
MSDREVMTIHDAMRAINDEYNAETMRARRDPAFNRLMSAQILEEYLEIDRELPGYVGDIAAMSGVKKGTILPDYVYQMARMCFRLGMRTQRKLDHPDQASSIFMTPEPLRLYTVYDHPSDFPDWYVVREFNYDQPGEIVAAAPDLEEGGRY